MKKKIIRVLIIIVSLILAFKVYESEYFIKANKASIEKGIEEFLELDVSILQYKKFQNILIVYYEAAGGDYNGSTILYRGINNRYQIRMAGYGMNNRVFSGKAFKSHGENYLAIMGTNYDLMINEVIIETCSNQKESFFTNGEKYLIKVFPSETEQKDLLKGYKLYNKQGNDITKQMDEYVYKRGGFGRVRGKAELFMLYVYCFTIIAVGYFASKMFIAKKGDKKIDDNID